LLRGDYPTALRNFDAVLAAAIKRELLTDAALIALDIAEAYAALDRQAEVAVICKRLVAVFKEAGMLNSRLTALAFLKTAAEKRQITKPILHQLRAFFEQSEANPSLIFSPPG